MTRGDAVVGELWLGPRAAGGRRVLEAAHHLLAATGTGTGDIGRIVVGVGPGGFTGLRIGIATALALGQALDVEVAGASSLEALALGVARHAGDGLVAPVIDARRREVFAAVYRAAGDALTEVVAPAAWTPAGFADAVRDAAAGARVTAGGDGVAVAREALAAAGAHALPDGAPGNAVRAADLVRRVQAGAGTAAVPAYLRLPDAEVNRLRAAAGSPA